MKKGSKIWHSGDEVEVISEPYTLHGGEFVDAETESGKVICIATEKHTQNLADTSRKDWKEQQEQFRSLR